MNYVDYREKLGIGFNDKEKFEYFKSFMLNVVFFPDQSYPPTFSDEEYFLYCLSIGQKYETSYGGDYWSEVFDLLKNSEDLNNFLAYYIFFLIHFKDLEGKKATKESLLQNLETALKASRIPYELIKDDNNYFAFPKGADELDASLINAPLEWMVEYPKSRGTFCRALKQYSNNEYTRDVADNLRKALEEFFQEFLENNKNLDNNIIEIFRYLGNNSAEPEIASMMKSLLCSYNNLNNSAAKHNDKLDPKYLEFLMYQTGLFIRMIITVGKE